MINVSVEIDTSFDIPVAQTRTQQIVCHVFDREKISDGRISIIFTTDENLRKMKHQFFNINAYTDVIAFNLEESGDPVDGELYISSERAYENSILFGETHESEITRLIVHGSLHLLGYDDQSQNDLGKMKPLEDQYLAEILPSGNPA